MTEEIIYHADKYPAWRRLQSLRIILYIGLQDNKTYFKEHYLYHTLLKYPALLCVATILMINTYATKYAYAHFKPGKAYVISMRDIGII